jgi:hypothetical protein
MPFVGLGLHVLIALYFAVHAVRTGQHNYWLFILFSFPLLGSVVYFLTVFLPNSRLERGARRVVRAAAKAMDPERELREARAAFDYTPTAQNQMRLAAALLDAGQSIESARAYDACLAGPFADDLEIRFGAARAHFASGHFAEALNHVDWIRRRDPEFRRETMALLHARVLDGLDRIDEAKAAFEEVLARFGSFEVVAEYAIWAFERRDSALSSTLMAQIEKHSRHWNRHTRDTFAPMMKRVQHAYNLSRQP